MSDQQTSEPPRTGWRSLRSFFSSGRVFALIGVMACAVAVVTIAYLLIRLSDDRPVTYLDARDHFKHGSTGGERGWKKQLGFGVPYWMWVALPELFPEYLPDQKPGAGYSSLGMIYEAGKDPRFDLPIGMSMRRVMGIDRVYFTCSVCHTGSVRERPGAPPQIVLGMPSNTLDFGRLAQFLELSAQDWRFQAGHIMPKIAMLADTRERTASTGRGYRPARFGAIDRAIFQYYGVGVMRDQLLTLLGQLSFLDFRSWGPGRVDTFNPPKSLLGFRMEHAPDSEKVGVADFPSVWNQRARKGMSLHWDGNNCSVDERNLSAGFGTGATPATVDAVSLLRIADWLWQDAQPPAFPAIRIDPDLAIRGEPIYQEYCQKCHGTRSAPFRGGADQDTSQLGRVTPIEEVATDTSRLDSYTPELARAQNLLYAGTPADASGEACRAYAESICQPAGDDAAYRAQRATCYPSRFSHFRKTYGYANQPLDGLWLRAPYLHNGSVPTLAALLEPSHDRPGVFFTGYDVYDFANVGFVTSGPDAERRGWRYDTMIRGNGNQGHEGPAYGTALPPDDKRALLEYLKTF
ncbi:MAG: di-heme-cytochrome C peroxidase [Vicinamibacterales bacterium]